MMKYLILFLIIFTSCNKIAAPKENDSNYEGYSTYYYAEPDLISYYTRFQKLCLKDIDFHDQAFFSAVHRNVSFLEYYYGKSSDYDSKLDTLNHYKTELSFIEEYYDLEESFSNLLSAISHYSGLTTSIAPYRNTLHYILNQIKRNRTAHRLLVLEPINKKYDDKINALSLNLTEEQKRNALLKIEYDRTIELSLSKIELAKINKKSVAHYYNIIKMIINNNPYGTLEGQGETITFSTTFSQGNIQIYNTGYCQFVFHSVEVKENYFLFKTFLLNNNTCFQFQNKNPSSEIYLAIYYDGSFGIVHPDKVENYGTFWKLQ